MFVDFSGSTPKEPDPGFVPTSDFFSNTVIDKVSIVETPLSKVLAASLAPLTGLSGVTYSDWCAGAYKVTACWLRDAYAATQGRLISKHRYNYMKLLNKFRWGQMMYCTPPFVRNSETHVRHCQVRVCPWCHVRNIVKIFQTISSALSSVSKGGNTVPLVVGSSTGYFPLAFTESGDPDFAAALQVASRFVDLQRKKLNIRSTAGSVSWAVPDLLWNEGKAQSIVVNYGVMAVQAPKSKRYKGWPDSLTRTQFENVPDPASLTEVICKTFPIPKGWWHNGIGNPFAGAMAFIPGKFRIKLSMTGAVRDTKSEKNSNSILQWMAVWSEISSKVGFEVTVDVFNDLLIKNGLPGVAGNVPSLADPKVKTSALFKTQRPKGPAHSKGKIMASLSEFSDVMVQFNDAVEELESSDRRASAAENFLHGADGKSGVVEKADAIDQTVNRNKRVTDNQLKAVKNMLAGVKAWLHQD